MSSILNVDTVRDTNNRIKLATTGSVVSYQQVFFPGYVNYNTTAAVEISQLRLQIKPKKASNLLIMEWMLQGEPAVNGGFRVFKNGANITTGGGTSYNNITGNTQQSVIIAAVGDGNTDSTPSNFKLTFWQQAGSTSAMTFAPAWQSSNTTAAAFRLNRYYTTSSERMVSFGYIMEISA